MPEIWSMQAEAGLGDEFDDETQVNKSYYDLVGVMKFMESHLPEGTYFNDWQEFEHPQLGAFVAKGSRACSPLKRRYYLVVVRLQANSKLVGSSSRRRCKIRQSLCWKEKFKN